MPEVAISVGGRPFHVTCRDGEEDELRAAAEILDGEARAVSEQAGRLPEARMLLMAGLMLADKAAAARDRAAGAEARLAEREAELEGLRAMGPPEPARVEVPVVPEAVTETLAELAARAEALAAEVEERAAG